MQIISSRDNPRLKLARRVRDGRERDLIFIEGLRLAEEALRSPLVVREAFVETDFDSRERGARLLETLAERGIPAAALPPAVLQTVADTEQTQGVVLLAERPASASEDFARRFALPADAPPLVLLFHEIGNPSNLGAVLRTAEAVGVGAVVVTRNSADPFAPKALRASMGAALRLNLWTRADFAEAVEWARANDLTTTAADVRAATPFDRTDWRRPRLLIFGSEAHGLPADALAALDERLVIPMRGGVESLNLAVSSGILLFEAARPFRQMS